MRRTILPYYIPQWVPHRHSWKLAVVEPHTFHFEEFRLTLDGMPLGWPDHTKTQTLAGSYCRRCTKKRNVWYKGVVTEAEVMAGMGVRR